MRLPTPRVIAIDDDPKHLEGLVQGLNRYGAALLSYHFDETNNIASCPHVRVIFVDLHLSGGVPREDHAQDFSVIGGVIQEQIKPSGPYFMVLWTQYPDQAMHLFKFLKTRLKGVTRPFQVLALDKSNYLDANGAINSPENLVEAIRQIVAKQPQMGALLNWEERVLEAASATVSSILDMSETAGKGEGLNQETGRILKILAKEAVGEKHVENDRFQAVNEALLPILADRLASMRSREVDKELWKNALDTAPSESKLSIEEIARLNRLLHIALPTETSEWTERGSAILLPKKFLDDNFKRTFSLTQPDAAKLFGCTDFRESDDQFCWMLVQTQASCDYDQVRPGPLPFHLGLCLPESTANKKKSHPAALWASPCFEYSGPKILHVHASSTSLR